MKIRMEAARPASTDGVLLPPHSVESEQAVLGGLMLDNRAWDEIADLVEEADFYRRDHQLIFRAIHDLIEREQPCDAVTVHEHLERQGTAAEVGGLPYIASIVRETPSAANTKTYALVVRERSTLRQLIHAANNIASSAYSPEGRDSVEIIDDADRHIFELSGRGGRSKSKYQAVGELLRPTMDRIEELSNSGSNVTGLETGFKALDEMTAGLQPGDLIIIAGRPSMGKSTLAVNIAEHLAINKKMSCGVFSMEMNKEQLMLRHLSSVARVNLQAIRTGQIPNAKAWEDLTAAMVLLRDAPLFIDDTGGLTPTELRARARRMHREQKLSLLVVDYLQLMHVPGSSENRATEVAEISRSLKALAKELKVPLIALSQLNRGVEQRADKRPLMSDLRESGGIEQDADVIMMIYREEFYDSATPRKGIADIIFTKQRNGPTGDVELLFRGEHSRFDNLV